MRPAFVERIKQSEFVCSACGADRDCNCSAPALQRLAELKEKERVKKAKYREKARENNNRVHGTDGADEAEWAAGSEQRWRNSLMNYALDTSSMREGWAETFGDRWSDFTITEDLVDAANRAVGEWTEIAAILRSKLNAQT